MKDNNFSGIIRSGTSHSVSVSERTGNAKTPKNIVTSDAEETASRLKAFEEKRGTAPQSEDAEVKQAEAVAAVAAELAPSSLDPLRVDQTQASDVPNIQTVAKEGGAANTQTISADDATPDNRQRVSSHAPVAPNVQSVSADVTEDNRQKVGGDQPAVPNVQNVNVDALSDNLQNVSENHVAANMQSVSSGQAVVPNVQAIPEDGIEANRQDVSTAQAVANKQAISGAQPLSDNLQAVASERMSDNLQSIEGEPTSVHTQALDVEQSAEPNVQTLTSETHKPNRQAIDGVSDTSPNQLAIPQETTPDNTQTLDVDAVTRRDESVAQSSQGVNVQDVAVSSPADNHQSLDVDGAQPNRQTLTPDETLTPNVQGLEAQAIEDHIEPLPSTEVTRETVDFSVAPVQTDAVVAQPSPSPASSPAQVAKDQVPHAAAKALTQSQVEQLAQKARHDKFTAAFQGRLAGIKNKVNDIHHKLDTFDKK